MDHHEFLSEEKTDENEEHYVPQDQYIDHQQTQQDRNEEIRPDVSNESLPEIGPDFEFPLHTEDYHNYDSECLFGDLAHISDTPFDKKAAYLSPTAGIRQIPCGLLGYDMASDCTNTNIPDFIQTVSSNLYEQNYQTTSFSQRANQVRNKCVLKNDQMSLPLSLEQNIIEPVLCPTDTIATLETNSFENSITDEMLIEQNTTIADPEFAVHDEANRVRQADEVAFYAENEDSFENGLTIDTENSAIKSDNLIRKNLCYGSSEFDQDFSRPSSSGFQAGNNIDTKTLGYKSARVPSDEDDPEEVNSTMDPQAQFQNKDRRFTCQECGKQFSFENRLREHTRYNHGEKPFACKHCKQRYAHQSKLTVHSRIHTGEKPFACKHCKKCFALQNSLTVHSRIHTGEKPYVCKNCNKGFAAKTNLKAHSLIHTGGKTYECSKCDKKYKYQSGLSSHFRKHTEEEPFKCRICGQVFGDENSLNIHKAMHG